MGARVAGLTADPLAGAGDASTSSRTRTVPGSAPERTASTTMARSAPSHVPAGRAGRPRARRRTVAGSAARLRGHRRCPRRRRVGTRSPCRPPPPCGVAGRAGASHEPPPSRRGSGPRTRCTGSWLRTACSQRHCSSSSPSSSAALGHPPQVRPRWSAGSARWAARCGRADRALVVDLVLVEQQAPGCLGGAGPDARPRRRPATAGGRAARRPRPGAAPRRRRTTSSTARTTMLRNGLVTDRPESGVARRLRRPRPAARPALSA